MEFSASLLLAEQVAWPHAEGTDSALTTRTSVANDAVPRLMNADNVGPGSIGAVERVPTPSGFTFGRNGAILNQGFVQILDSKFTSLRFQFL